MRVKTSVSLSSELLDEIDQYSAEGERSEFVERAIRNYIRFLDRQARNRADEERINRIADYLNSEAADVLSYQVPL